MSKPSKFYAKTDTFYNVAMQANILALADESLWFSHHERAWLLDDTGAFPDELKRLALDALKVEADWRNGLKSNHPKYLQHLLDLKAWLINPEKSVDNFPGWELANGQTTDDQEPATTMVPAPEVPAVRPEPDSDFDEVPLKKSKNKTSTKEKAPLPPIKSWDQPTDPSILARLSVHPFAKFDEDRFARLLMGSISLSIAEKKRVIDAVPTLSQFQINELFKLFKEEIDEFSRLWETESKAIISLDCQSLSDISVLRLLCRLDESAETQSRLAKAYWEIERDLIVFDYEGAECQAVRVFSPDRFITYELWFKTRKALGLVDGEWTQQLQELATDSGGAALSEAVRLLIDLEHADKIDLETLRSRLTEFDPPPDLAWVKPYLLSRFHAFLDSDAEAFHAAFRQLALAIDMLDSKPCPEREILTAQIQRLLLLIDAGAARTVEPNRYASLGLYWQTVGELFQSKTSNSVTQTTDVNIEVISDLIYHEAERIGFSSPLGLATGQRPGKRLPPPLTEHLATLGQLLRGFGFVPESEDGEAYRACSQALAEDRLDQAETLLNGASRTPLEAVRWFDVQAALWRRRKRLISEIVRLRDAWRSRPSAINGLTLFAALQAAGHNRRAEALALAENLARRFWYLPVFQSKLYEVHHYFFTQNSDQPAAIQALQRGLALGPEWDLFSNIADFHRWKAGGSSGSEQESVRCMVADFAAVSYGCNHYKSALIVAAEFLPRDKAPLALQLLAALTWPYASEVYSCLAIGLARSRGQVPAALAANARSIALSPEPRVVLFSNSAADFCQFARSSVDHEFAWRWCLYRSAVAIWYDQHHAWLQYSNLLNAASKLHRPELAFAAYCVGRDRHAPGIEKTHRETVRSFLATMVQDGILNLAPVSAGPWLAFLARVVAEESEWLISHHGVLTPMHQVVDILRRLDALEVAEAAGNGATAFLAREADHCRRALMVRGEWLLLRWPVDTGTERHRRRVTLLAQLAEEFPDAGYRHQLERTVDDWQRRPLYRALSGGRIAHSHTRTLRKVSAVVKEVIRRFAEFCANLQRQRGEVSDRHTHFTKDTLRRLIEAWSGAFDALAPKAREALYGDWSLALNRETPTVRHTESSITIPTIVELGRSYGLFSGDENDKENVSRLLKPWNEQRDLGIMTLVRLESDEIKKHKNHWREVFQHVLAGHALAESDLFESFRTRIRHGWLISSLRDCFARFDLYHDGDTDTILTPGMEQALIGLAADKCADLEDGLRNLRAMFRSLVQSLHDDWLWLNDKNHPNGLLDLREEHFVLAPLMTRLPLGPTPAETLIDVLCGAIDDTANLCFNNIRLFLREKIEIPLDEELKKIERILQILSPDLQKLPDGTHLFVRLKGQLTEARREFAARMQDYQSWFAFQENGVRDFTIAEIAQLAWTVVAEVDSRRLQAQGIMPPQWVGDTDPAIRSFLLAGSNFSDLLEIFKILFQNVVYHAKPNAEIEEAVALVITLDVFDQGTLRCRVASTCFAPQRLDVDGLRTMLSSPTERRSRTAAKRGSGLATVQEILQHRLERASGTLRGPWLIASNSEMAPTRQRLPDGAEWFTVDLALTIHKQLSPTELPPQLPPRFHPEDVIRILKKSTIRILIVEDQDSKFNALSKFIDNQLPGCGIARTSDLESTARLLTSVGADFTLVVLDMTLPEDQLPDSQLKSLAGIDVLKIMTDNQLHIPTVLVTQYSNWASEAHQNTRQFMDDLSRFCLQNHQRCFCGAVRFSHTDLEWQNELLFIINKVKDEKNL